MNPSHAELHRATPEGRSFSKAIAQALLPSSLVVWHGPSDRRRVALSFDDGPTDLTRAYLDVLEKFGAQGTFFLVGGLCAARPQLVAEIDARGHGLGNHGYSHRAFNRFSRGELVANEIERTDALLPPRARRQRYVRPPFGTLSLGALLACGRAGFKTVLWSCDSGDWSTRCPDDVVHRVDASTLRPGAIVLLHDGQSWTLQALPRVLGELRELGYELVTVARLLGDEA